MDIRTISLCFRHDAETGEEKDTNENGIFRFGQFECSQTKEHACSNQFISIYILEKGKLMPFKNMRNKKLKFAKNLRKNSSNSHSFKIQMHQYNS